MQGTNDPAIRMVGLAKRYGPVVALDGLTLDIPEGSVFGFLGPNGAGKTTAIKILAGLTRASGGTATIAGMPVSIEGGHRRVLGYLAQEPRFYQWMTGRETLRYVASFFPGVAHPERQADDLLRLAGIADAADRQTRTYSGGMLQRLGIAQALVGRPSVVILDEPAAALDPLGRRDVLALLHSLRNEATILFSTHILEDVQRTSDHVAILDHGKLVRASSIGDLMGSFSRDRLVVVTGGADESAAVAFAALPGVAGVTLSSRLGETRTYEIQTDPGALPAVQAAITRLAADRDLVLIRNEREVLDLESVFVRLVEHQEVAA